MEELERLSKKKGTISVKEKVLTSMLGVYLSPNPAFIREELLVLKSLLKSDVSVKDTLQALLVDLGEGIL